MNTTVTNKSILLIDDEDYICQIVQLCLENFSNWQATIVPSAEEGLAAIANAKPEAILLDMKMPGMDGFTFLKRLQADPEVADIPVVLFTSRTDLIEPKKLAQLGVKGAIAKPFHPIKLAPEIAKILGWQLND